MAYRFPRRLLLSLIAALILSIPAVTSANEILYVRASGIVNPVMSEYVRAGLAEASKERAAAFIIELDTPGGFDTSMREIVKAEFSSDVPVVVYVAPSGARAASAGVFITYAAGVAAMAPGTNIGSAHPVSMYGKMGKTMEKKVENDAAAYIMSIAEKRNRNAAWAEKAVRRSANITADEALKLGVINLIAANMADLVGKLDGMKADTSAGPRVITTRGAEVKEIPMSARYRILDIISDPNVAYLLLMIGLVGLYFEFAHPGAVLPGVAGVLCLVLAFYALQTLPVNYAGLLLMALGIILFILEIKIASYGLLTIAGIISLLLGSLMLFESSPFIRLSMLVVLPAVVFMAAFVSGTMYYALRIRRRRPVSGAESLVGRECLAADDFNGDLRGRVFMAGEYWNAVCDMPVKKDETLRVVEVNGLLLKVSKK